MSTKKEWKHPFFFAILKSAEAVGVVLPVMSLRMDVSETPQAFSIVMAYALCHRPYSFQFSMKDVGVCDKLRGADTLVLIRRCPNGETGRKVICTGLLVQKKAETLHPTLGPVALRRVFLCKCTRGTIVVKQQVLTIVYREAIFDSLSELDAHRDSGQDIAPVAMKAADSVLISSKLCALLQ